MSKLYVARRKNRVGLSIPMGQVSQSPNLLFPLTRSTDPSQLDELIRSELDKLGVTRESDVQAILDKAETDYEFRIKVAEARKEIRRLMEIRANGGKLMSTGNKKWSQVFHRPISKDR